MNRYHLQRNKKQPGDLVRLFLECVSLEGLFPGDDGAGESIAPAAVLLAGENFIHFE